MKKIYSFILVAVLCISVCACGEKKGTAKNKLGLGVVGNVSSNSEKAEFNATVAAVVTDENDKIVACKIDAVENAVKIENGTADRSVTVFKTKQEMADEYGMREYSGIKKEWYEQADFFADYVVGMTATEVLNIKTTVDGDKKKAAEDIILAGCTVDISGFISSVVEACDDPKAKSFEASSYKLGIGIDSLLSDENDEGEKVKFDITLSAAITDKSNKTVAMITDALEPEIEIGDDESERVVTKREAGNDYGMKENSPIGKEWYEQADAFAEYAVGLDADGIATIKLKNDGSHKAEDEYLTAGCTVAVDGFMRSAIMAINNAGK